MDQYHLIEPSSQIHMQFEDLNLIARILIQSNLADAKHVVRAEEFRNESQNFFGQFYILRLLGINAKPAKMGQTKFGSSLRLMLGELTEIIIEAGGGTAVEPGPERLLANGLAPGELELKIIIRHAADHVGVGFDVVHWH